ncbi:MAG: thermonuclease family protein [Nitrososphaeraceae archaeon]
MGTKINNLKVVKVVDGDTINVELNGEIEKLRLICVDTEESHPGGSKPVTVMGKNASEMAKQYFNLEENPNGVFVDIEFDTDDPVEVCLKKHRGNYGRLLCYVHKDSENYNFKLIHEGWSPYFEKYGRSRIYHNDFTNAEFFAQAHDRNIWNTIANQQGQTRGKYCKLKNWWSTRALVVEDYRNYGISTGVLSVRLDYDKIKQASEQEENITVLCDLQSGIDRRSENGAVIFAGSKYHKFNLWIPDIDSDESERIINLIEKRYSGTEGNGYGYVYVSGKVTKYNNTPQIILTDIKQLSDFPPST